jgi:hypothetical protein
VKRAIETRQRRKPVMGGTSICSKCDQPRVHSSSYCRVHKNEHAREWLKRRTAEFHQLKAETN